MRGLLVGLLCGLVMGCQVRSDPTVAIDEILHRSDARYGTFGPTGKRVFTERLDEGPGIRGQFCYIHHADIRDPIKLDIAQRGQVLPVEIDKTDWYPSHLVVQSRVGSLSLVERKFITDDDTFVDRVTFTNTSPAPVEYQLHLSSGFARVALATKPWGGRPGHHLLGAANFYGVKAHAVAAACGLAPEQNESTLVRVLSLSPGSSFTLTAVMSISDNLETAVGRANNWAIRSRPLEHHRKTYQRWFDENCPRFECDDAYITKLYWYRWFVARHCLSRACAGRLPEPCFFEGTHQKHFPRLIAFSSPHIISETRWLRDPRYAYGQVRNHCLNPDPEHGFFISSRIDQAGGDYNNWIVKSAWEAFWVHPDRAWLGEVIDALAGDVLGTLSRFDRDGDKLPTPRTHWSTGMEFQPAFFYFNDYDNTKPEAPLERGDFAAQLYGNAAAVAEAYRFMGNEREAERFGKLADEIRHACLTKMWDDKDGFCYGIRESDDVVARCREVVGFYPFMSRLFPDEPRYMAALAYLIDPEEFWTAYPPATVTKKCPAYTHKVATWPAAGGKTHGCMWNGPSWPHATSVMLDVAAAAIQDYTQSHVRPEHFWRMFDRYTHLQFEQGDLGRPMVTEYYDGQTGEPDPTGCPDYFHSTYCDLVIRYIVGLQPANSNRLTLRPIPGPVKRFALRGVRYRGCDIDVVYDHASGLTVWIDGQRAAHRATLGDLAVELPGRE